MTNYKITNLTSDTAQAEQDKLTKGLKGMAGVSTVALHPERSEIELGFHKDKEPKREIVAEVVSKSGFTLGTVRV